MNGLEMCGCGHVMAQHDEDGCLELIDPKGDRMDNHQKDAWCPCKRPESGDTTRERFNKLGAELGRMLAEDLAEIERG